MSSFSRRAIMVGGSAALAAPALPPAPLTDWERRIRAIIVGNVEQAAAELATARTARIAQAVTFHRYAYALHLDELAAFDRGGGSWREIFVEPVSPAGPDRA